VTNIKAGQLKLGVQAPREVEVMREELLSCEATDGD